MEQPKEQFKTSVGGQALMEGIMMRGPEKICCAVRRPDGEIDLKMEDVKHHPWQKIPLVRGSLAMIESMVLGYRYLMHSAEVSMGEDFEQEESKFDKWVNEHCGPKAQNALFVLAALLGGGLAILLFMVQDEAGITLDCSPVRCLHVHEPVANEFKHWLLPPLLNYIQLDITKELYICLGIKSIYPIGNMLKFKRNLKEVRQWHI